MRISAMALVLLGHIYFRHHDVQVIAKNSFHINIAHHILRNLSNVKPRNGDSEQNARCELANVGNNTPPRYFILKKYYLYLISRRVHNVWSR